MRFRVIKLVGIFSLFVTAVFLYTFSEIVPGTSSYFTKLFQERSTKENHLSTGNQIQLIQANEQLIIFITSAPFYTSRRLSIRQVDNDVYLHVPKMIWWLKTSSIPEKLYAGAVINGGKVIRNPKHKWFVSEQFLNDTLFPPYCNGPFYILSKSTLLELLKVSSNEGLTPFPLEDAYIGILAKRVEIAPLQLLGKHVLIVGPWKRIGWEGKKLNDFFALGHALSIKRMFKLHARFTN